MEADLSRYHHIDYRDRWRFDDHGRKLTLRMIFVRLRHLPPDAAVFRVMSDGRPVWDLQHILLADIWQAAAQSKKPHPLLEDERRDRKRNQALPAERRKKLVDARRRRLDRRRALGAAID